MKKNWLLYLGWRVPISGSNSNNSSNASGFTLNVNNVFSNANVNIATHLCLFFNFIFKYNNLASWQKTKKSLIQFSRLNLEILEVK